MTTQPLTHRIMAILSAQQGQALSFSDLERRLASQDASQPVDHFAVVDAVWRLIDLGHADFTPRRHIRLAGQLDPKG